MFHVESEVLKGTAPQLCHYFQQFSDPDFAKGTDDPISYAKLTLGARESADSSMTPRRSMPGSVTWSIH